MHLYVRPSKRYITNYSLQLPLPRTMSRLPWICFFSNTVILSPNTDQTIETSKLPRTPTNSVDSSVWEKMTFDHSMVNASMNCFEGPVTFLT